MPHPLRVETQSPVPWYRRWYVVGWLVVVVISIIVLGIFGAETNRLIDQVAVDDFIDTASQTTRGDQVTLVPQAAALGQAADTVVNTTLLIDSADPTLGTPGAPLTIVEFSDFQCPFCRASYPIIREFVATHQDDVFFVYKDFPIDEIHPLASTLAQAGQCAHDQGMFWQMHDAVFQNQDSITTSADMYAVATQVGLDVAVLEQCVTAGDNRSEVENDLQTGLSNGAIGTPTFFVNGHRLTGVVPLSTWEQILDIVTNQ